MSAFTSLVFSSSVGASPQELDNLRSRIRSFSSTNTPNQYGITPRPARMTLIPPDSKDPRHGPPEVHTDSELPATAPPPYAFIPTPTSSVAASSIAPEDVDHDAEFLEPKSMGSSQQFLAKIPDSDAVSASSSVKQSGPLKILGDVKSSGSVTLSNKIHVCGKVNASSSITLYDIVTVEGKVNASSKIELRNGVHVKGKADASGSVLIEGGENGVKVDEKVSCSGSCTINAASKGVIVGEKVDASGAVRINGGSGKGVRIGGKVSSKGMIELRGNVYIGGDLDASGKVYIYCSETRPNRLYLGGHIKCNGSCNIEGDMDVDTNFQISSNLNLNGKLHVKGDLNVKGNVNLQPGAVLIVDGRRTIHGSIKNQ